MPAASFPRRAAGLVAAGTVGLSTLLAPGTAGAATYDIDVTGAVDRTVTIPSTVCAVEWEIGGAIGGNITAGTGQAPTYGLYGMAMHVTTTVTPGGTLMIQPGQKGGSVTGGTTDAGAGGTSGTRPSGGSGGAGAAGGGGATIVRNGATVDSPFLLVAAGGGGAGTNGNGGDAFDWPEGTAYFIPPYTGQTGPAISGGGPGDGERERVFPGTPGSGGAPVNGATGTTGEAGTALLGGDGPAGAGGGGGGVLGGGSGGSDGTRGSGGGAGSSFSTAVVESAGNWIDRNMDPADNWVGFARGTFIACGSTPAPTTPAPASSTPVPAPATVPAGNGPLGTPQGAVTSVAPGQKLTLTGSGYAPNSAVELYVYSTPQRIGSVTADASGRFSVVVTLPTGLVAGKHSLVATGLDANGAPRFLRMDVTLGKRLAATGADVVVPAVAGVAALALGGGLIALARRRRSA
ncbi:LPXTG cell wall anchor domain-containing protein [Blastococcus sp. SYSU D00922]